MGLAVFFEIIPVFWPVFKRWCAGDRTEDAHQLFKRLLSLRNDVGLLSEEYDPHAKRLVGNFPQAFSHIALVNTAHNLSQTQKPARQRSGQLAPQ
jgi:GH15 family glucan-1,4-alpha-glucosidase